MSSLEGLRAGEERGQFCWCPPGSFTMGPFAGPPVSGPATSVTLYRGFWIGKHLVTQAQYQFIMGENPSSFVGASLPVDTVDKSQAEAFCAELTRVERASRRLAENCEYRLPTEAQWEYACRAGTTTKWSWGDDEKEIGDYAWYGANSSQKTHAVGQKKPNPWGLYDMHGNCDEWCRDTWSDTLPGGVDPEVKGNGVAFGASWQEKPFWVCRGGSWQYPEVERLMSTNRERLGWRDKSYLISFRVVLVT
jgi:formylglycine-generating enzyme required for sulfatase activity